MSNEKLINLVRRLSLSTSEGVINWGATEKSGVFQSSLAGYAVRVDARKSKVHAGENEYFITIIDPFGDVVEEMGDEEFDGGYSIMKNLYDSARRESLGVDKAIDEILKDLDKRDILDF
jgi:hypothetical protein